MGSIAAAAAGIETRLTSRFAMSLPAATALRLVDSNSSVAEETGSRSRIVDGTGGTCAAPLPIPLAAVNTPFEITAGSPTLNQTTALANSTRSVARPRAVSVLLRPRRGLPNRLTVPRWPSRPRRSRALSLPDCLYPRRPRATWSRTPGPSLVGRNTLPSWGEHACPPSQVQPGGACQSVGGGSSNACAFCSSADPISY